MYPNRLIFLGLLLSAAGRFTAEALSTEEKGLLEIARAAAIKTYGQDTFHETASYEASDTRGFGRKTIADRVQRKNTGGGRDVYAIVADEGIWAGITILKYKMDELVFKGVAWARLIEGEYPDDIPTGWFKPEEESGLDFLQEQVMDQYSAATGELAIPFLEDESVSSITKLEDSSPETQCFKVTLTEEVSAGEVDYRTLCVKGGFLVNYNSHTEVTEFDSESSFTYTLSRSVDFSKFGEPVEIPDPTQPSDLKQSFKRAKLVGTSLGYV